MKIFKFVLPVFTLLLLSAHYSRADNLLMTIVFIILPFLFFIRKTWVRRMLQLALIFGTGVWIQTAINIVKIRIDNDMDWIRLAIILGAIALLTLFSAILLEFKRFKNHFDTART